VWERIWKQSLPLRSTLLQSPWIVWIEGGKQKNHWSLRGRVRENWKKIKDRRRARGSGRENENNPCFGLH
jgi:hypothetical protein